MWSMSLDVFLISDILSETICGIKIKGVNEDEESWLSVVGVYFPCLDLGISYYGETLIELKRVISDSSSFSPVITTSNFIAHLRNF